MKIKCVTVVCVFVCQSPACVWPRQSQSPCRKTRLAPSPLPPGKSPALPALTPALSVGHVTLVLLSLPQFSSEQLSRHSPECDLQLQAELLLHHHSSWPGETTVPPPDLFIFLVLITGSVSSSSSLLFFQLLLPAGSTSLTFNVTAHEVGQVTSYLLSNSTSLPRWV